MAGGVTVIGAENRIVSLEAIARILCAASIQGMGDHSFPQLPIPCGP